MLKSFLAFFLRTKYRAIVPRSYMPSSMPTFLHQGVLSPSMDVEEDIGGGLISSAASPTCLLGEISRFLRSFMADPPPPLTPFNRIAREAMVSPAIRSPPPRVVTASCCTRVNPWDWVAGFSTCEYHSSLITGLRIVSLKSRQARRGKRTVVIAEVPTTSSGGSDADTRLFRSPPSI